MGKAGTGSRLAYKAAKERYRKERERARQKAARRAALSEGTEES